MVGELLVTPLQLVGALCGFIRPLFGESVQSLHVTHAGLVRIGGGDSQLRSVVIWSSVYSLQTRAKTARSPIGRDVAVLMASPPYPWIAPRPHGLLIIYPGQAFCYPSEHIWQMPNKLFGCRYVFNSYLPRRTRRFDVLLALPM